MSILIQVIPRKFFKFQAKKSPYHKFASVKNILANILAMYKTRNTGNGTWGTRGI